MNDPYPSAKPVLNIAVVGVGAIGSTFAYHLARAGHDVTAIARPDSARLLQLQRDEAVILSSGEKAGLRVTDRLDEDVVYDLVLVTMLAHQLDAVLPALSRSKAAALQFMFNNFEPERLSKAVGEGRCSFGMPFVMSTLDSNGRLETRANPGQKTLHGDARWAELFAAAGMASAFEPEMRLWLRCHAPICIAMESICVAGQRRGGGSTWREAVTVARGLRSGFAIIKALATRCIRHRSRRWGPARRPYSHVCCGWPRGYRPSADCCRRDCSNAGLWPTSSPRLGMRRSRPWRPWRRVFWQ